MRREWRVLCLPPDFLRRMGEQLVCRSRLDSTYMVWYMGTRRKNPGRGKINWIPDARAF